jgi:hypothetical protein
MATPPDRYPLHDTKDTNSASLPTIYSLNGFFPNSIGDSRAVNKLLQSNGGWVKFNDFTLVRSSDVNSSTTAYRLSSANLAYTTGAGLGPFSPTAYTAVYVYRGNVIRFSSSFCVDNGIDPITFTASMRTWIYCNENGVVRIAVVALATAAAPAAGEFTVIAVDTDATNITAIVTSSSPAFELHFTGPAVVVESAFGVLSNAFFGGDVLFTGALTAESGLAVAGVITAYGETATLVVNGDAVFAERVTVASTNVTSAAVSGTNTSTGPGVRGQSTGNAGVSGASASSVAGVVGTNSGAGPGVKGTGGSAAAGVDGTATVAAQPGVKGTGAAAAGSSGVSGTAVNTASYGVQGSSSAAATTSGAGVRADALGDGVALSAVAVNGNAGRFESDTSSPTRAPVLVVAQDADASSTQVGSLALNSTRSKWRTYISGYESFHSTTKGYVFACGATESGGLGNTGNLSQATIVPEQVGDVLVSATISVVFTNDASNITLTLIDVTNGSAVIATQVENSFYYNGGGTVDNARSMSISVRYTLPSAASRTFAVKYTVGGGGTVSYSGATCWVQGLL